MTQTADILGNGTLVYKGGAGTNDNDIAIQSGDVSNFDTFMIFASTGAMDVDVSLDGANYTTAPLSLQDMTSSSGNPVLVTTAGGAFGFRGKFAAIRLRQNGATGVTNATLRCGKL